MDQNKQCIALLKKKGTGKTMGKSLVASELNLLKSLFPSKRIPLTTKATLLTALLCLPATPDEREFITTLRNEFNTLLPKELHNIITPPSQQSNLYFLIQNLINGKDIDKKESEYLGTCLLDVNIQDYEKAIFLEALRLKTETWDENISFLNHLWNNTTRIKVNIPILVDIADPYDGFNRHAYSTLFSAVLLSSIGIPTLLHGVDEVGPKKGINTHKLLICAKKNPIRPLSEIKQDLENPKIGWAYADQSEFSPKLYALKTMRQEMVKRTLLSTHEKLLQPCQPTGNHHIIAGYTHPPYKELLQKLLKEKNPHSKNIIMRGLEGSTQLPIGRQSRVITQKGKQLTEEFLIPDNYGLTSKTNIVEPDITSHTTVQIGLAALNGRDNELRNSILYQCQVIITKLGLMTQIDAYKKLTNSLDSGHAAAHWLNGMSS